MTAAERLEFKTSMTFTYGEPAELAAGVIRLVANNPGPFTFKGTNTYLVGEKQLAVIDPGPDDPAHCQAILRAAGGRPITHILVTHTHRDHVDGLPRLKAATGAKTCGHCRTDAQRGTIATSPSGTEFVDLDFRPDVSLSAGDRIEGADWGLAAIHTPGHAPDHLCFALEMRDIIFSGDHVMAWNTSVVAPPEGRMADYLKSLELLLDRTDEMFLPGHGGRLMEPQRTVKAYLLHRRWREQSIHAAIKGGTNTIRSLVRVVYRGLDDRLLPAAALSVQAHAEHLIERGLVTCDGPLTLDRALSAV